MIVLCPSRGRPANAGRLMNSFLETVWYKNTVLVFALDRDDPKLQEYTDTLIQFDRHDCVILNPHPHGSGAASNEALPHLVRTHHSVYGWVGDDHKFVTQHWDHKISEALVTPGIAYPNDLYQRGNLPTCHFVSAKIVRALGWFVLPDCPCLYGDNAWKTLGLKLNCLRYLDDVVIEHLHPAAGKADWDDSYRKSNSGETIERDRKAYENWVANKCDADVERIKAVLK